MFNRLRTAVANLTTAVVTRNGRKFNCQDQSGRAWLDRAEIAAELVRDRSPALTGRAPILCDIGCGDRKLKRMLEEKGVSVDYRGLDLIPQHASVTPFNLENDNLPLSCEIGVLLGVLEYCESPESVLRKLRPQMSSLVLSHAVSDVRKQSDHLKLGWKSHLTKDQFEQAIASAGFSIEETRRTANGKSFVWYCR